MDFIIIALLIIFGCKPTTIAGALILIGLLKLFIKIDDFSY